MLHCLCLEALVKRIKVNKLKFNPDEVEVMGKEMVLKGWLYGVWKGPDLYKMLRLNF